MNSQRGRKQNNRQQRSNRSTIPSQVSALVRANRITNPEPPTFDPSIRFRHRFRFQVTGAPETGLNLYQINNVDIANLLGVIDLTVTPATVVYTQTPIITRYRVRKIQAWQIDNSLTISYQTLPSNGLASTNTEVTKSDTATGSNDYAYVMLRPTATSSIGQWQSAITMGGGFQISCFNGAIIDLTLDLWLNNGDPAGQFGVYGLTGTMTGLTLGQLVVNPLDPSGLNPSFINPIGYAAVTNSNTPTPRP